MARSVLQDLRPRPAACRRARGRSLPLALALTVAPGPVLAQQDEVIEDPTMQLAAAPPAAASPAPPPPSPSALPPPRITGEASTRLALDTAWDTGGEDVIDWRQTVRVGVAVPFARAWQVVAGVRASHWTRAAHADDALLAAPRAVWELLPWETYVDGSAGPLRVRVGNQVIAVGRLDAGSAADVIAPLDLRDPFVTDPGALRLPVPAARVDWDARPWLRVTAAYAPVFVGHRVDLGARGGNRFVQAGAAMGLGSMASLRAAVDRYVAPGRREDVGRALSEALAPPDSGFDGEALARVEARSARGAVAITYGTAHARIPTVTLSAGLRAFAAAPSFATAQGLQVELASGTTLAAARYDRYHQVALDAETSVGPFTVAFEVGFTPARTLYVTRPGAVLPEARETALAQAGVHAEWSPGEKAQVVLELFALAPQRVLDAGEQWLLFRPGARVFLGGLAAGRYALFDGELVLELAAVVTRDGPSAVVLPRATWAPGDHVRLGAGAFLAAGEADTPSLGGAARAGSAAYVFARYLY